MTGRMSFSSMVGHDFLKMSPSTTPMSVMLSVNAVSLCCRSCCQSMLSVNAAVGQCWRLVHATVHAVSPKRVNSSPSSLNIALFRARQGGDEEAGEELKAAHGDTGEIHSLPPRHFNAPHMTGKSLDSVRPVDNPRPSAAPGR